MDFSGGSTTAPFGAGAEGEAETEVALVLGDSAGDGALAGAKEFAGTGVVDGTGSGEADGAVTLAGCTVGLTMGA